MGVRWPLLSFFIKQVYSMAGQVYEEIGEFTKSICAYLKAYSYDEDTENRPQRVQKIDQLCSIVLKQSPAKIPGKRFESVHRNASDVLD